jgi:hypothetical protein
MAFNLGFILGNGWLQHPEHISLKFVGTHSPEVVGELPWCTPGFKGGVGGRVDDYMVPLRPGSTYTLVIRPDASWSPDGNGLLGVRQVWAQFQGTGEKYINSGQFVSLFDLWKGGVKSNVLSFHE